MIYINLFEYNAHHFIYKLIGIIDLKVLNCLLNHLPDLNINGNFISGRLMYVQIQIKLWQDIIMFVELHSEFIKSNLRILIL